MKTLYWWIISYLILMLDFLLGIYFYISISGLIPTHFNFAGKPTAYGESTLLYWMLIPISHLSILVLLNVVYYYRWTLINKYPYLINVPAFMMVDRRLDESKKKYYVNKIYSILSLVGVYVGVLMIFIEFSMGYSSIIEYYGTVFIIGILIFSVFLVIGIILYYKKIYMDYKKELSMNFIHLEPI